MYTLLVLVLLSSGRGALASTVHLPDRSNLAVKVIAVGEQGGCQAGCYHLITNALQWRLFWSQHLRFFESGPLPPINFTRQVVLVAEVGKVLSRHYVLKISRVTEVRGRLRIEVEQKDGPDCCAPYEVPFLIASVASRLRNADFFVTYEDKFCSFGDRVFCGDVGAPDPVNFGGKCGPQKARIMQATCFAPSQLTRAERGFPTKPFNPSSVIRRSTGLRLSKIIVESEGNEPNTPQVPYAIHYLYGKFPLPSTSLRVVVGGQLKLQIPLFSVSKTARFLDVTEHLVPEDQTPGGSWIQQDVAAFNPPKSTRSFLWRGPWRFNSRLRRGLTLALSSYTKSSVVESIGLKILAAAASNRHARGSVRPKATTNYYRRL